MFTDTVFGTTIGLLTTVGLAFYNACKSNMRVISTIDHKKTSAKMFAREGISFHIQRHVTHMQLIFKQFSKF